MHPITVVEITSSVIFIIVVFVIALLLPSKIRKFSLITALLITVLLLLFFAIRPYWIDYQVLIKTEQLNQYLVERYPNQEWEIKRKVGRQYNPYHLEVSFNNENGWTYTYSVVTKENIHQIIWTPPEGKFFDEGKHFEGNQFE